MYLLTYYDDLKTLITPIGPPYLQADMAKDAMKRAILELSRLVVGSVRCV